MNSIGAESFKFDELKLGVLTHCLPGLAKLPVALSVRWRVTPLMDRFFLSTIHISKMSYTDADH